MKQSFSTVATTTTILTALFSDTAVSKIIHRDFFISVLQQIPVAAKGAGLLAWVIPLAGLCCVLLLFFPPAHSPPARDCHCTLTSLQAKQPPANRPNPFSRTQRNREHNQYR